MSEVKVIVATVSQAVQWRGRAIARPRADRNEGGGIRRRETPCGDKDTAPAHGD